MLPKGSQVKCWACEYKTYHVGDSVPSIPYFGGSAREYIVLLAEGGCVRVEDNKIVKIVESQKAYYPEDFDLLCVDKWGETVRNRADLEHRNIMGGHYYGWLGKTGG